MSKPSSESEVMNWLQQHGWSDGRDIGPEADKLIEYRRSNSAAQGFPLIPIQPAVDFVHRYGMLRLPHPRTPDCVLVMDPTFGYNGDAATITELGGYLGTSLFPIGYEASEYGILLADDRGRIFQLHHTGGYYMGEDAMDTFARFIGNVREPEAMDYFVERGEESH
ncbi:SUKH-3 domain-containing protein [Nocardia takedensis]